jgi:hypothetical protein
VLSLQQKHKQAADNTLHLLQVPRQQQQLLLPDNANGKLTYLLASIPFQLAFRLLLLLLLSSFHSQDVELACTC